MRPLTPFASYHDNAGRLLVGRVRFCNLDGSPANVFSRTGLTLGTSVYTDSSGRLSQQPFLGDHDYVLYFDRYVGAGTMAEDDDQESWEEQGSAIDRYNTVNIVTDGRAVTAVANIADLREQSPVFVSEFDGKRIVQLLGYYRAGDKPAVKYVWELNNVKNDDGGSVIKLNGITTGRWVMVLDDSRVDTRHFGAFPSQSDDENLSQRFAIQKANLYARDNMIGLYFYADYFNVFYDITGLTIYDVDCNPYARLYSVGSKSYVVGIEKVYLGGRGNGWVELVNPVVRVSWEGEYSSAIFSPSETLVIDKVPNPRSVSTWTGLNVEIYASPGDGQTFESCNITSNGAIDEPVTIRGCVLKTAWFSDGYDWSDLTSIDNVILLDNCADADTYVLLKNKQSEADYGSLNGGTVSNVTLRPNAKLSDAIINNVTVSGGTELSNVSGTFVVGNGNLALSARRCRITCTNASDDINVAGLNIEESSFEAENRIVLPGGNVAISDSDINARLYLTGGWINLKRCRINKSIEHIGYPKIQEVVVGCEFYAQLNIWSLYPDTVVSAVWKDNIGFVESPLAITRNNLKSNDSYHEYVYEGNSGTFLPGKGDTVTSTSLLKVKLKDAGGALPTTQETDGKILMCQYSISGSPSYTDVGVPIVVFVSSFSVPFYIFRIGTDSFKAIVNWSVEASNAVNKYISPSPFVANVNFAGGNSWNIACSNGPIVAGARYFAPTESSFSPYEVDENVSFSVKAV